MTHADYAAAEALEAIADAAGYDLYLEEAIAEVEGAPDQELAEEHGVFTPDFLAAANDCAADMAREDGWSRYEWSETQQERARNEIDAVLADSQPIEWSLAA